MDTEPVEFFVALESRVWEALVNGDPDADRSSLSEDFLGVYPTGFADRDEHAAQLENGPTMTEYAIENARIQAITPDDVLLAYEARYRRTGSLADERMFISSLWSRREGQWLNVFSQDTPAEERS